MNNIKLRYFANFFPRYNELLYYGTRPLKTPQQILEEKAKGQQTEVDLRSLDCSLMDLSEYNAQDITFDERTIFPSNEKKMPQNFNPAEIMENHKNPGLNIHFLHKRDITGTGTSIAIIDQLLSDHTEYRDNLVHYEEIGFDQMMDWWPGTMHGTAVSSIAVGKTCGVAPGAKLYYFAAQNMAQKTDGSRVRICTYQAQALERIIQINSTLPPEEKIQIVSASFTNKNCEDAPLWDAAVQHAQQTGLVICAADSPFSETTQLLLGSDRKVNENPDDINSYFRLVHLSDNDNAIPTFPQNHRTTASPTGFNEFVHYNIGGESWKVPFAAGLFLLARQIDPSITPQKFCQAIVKTAIFKENVGTIANPVAMIKTIRGNSGKGIPLRVLHTHTR